MPASNHELATEIMIEYSDAATAANVTLVITSMDGSPVHVTFLHVSNHANSPMTLTIIIVYI
jgi:hypothetical protein